MTSRANTLELISNLLRKSNMYRQASTFTTELSQLYKPSINKQKDNLMELIKEKVDIVSQSDVARKWRTFKGYYTLEMAPPSNTEEMKKLKTDIAVLKDVFKKGCYKFLTVRQAWLLFLVGTEVGLWFFLGETIGKFHIVGYQV